MPSLWWIAGVPWIILCIFGMVSTLPLILVIFGMAGGAQADWMSDGEATILFFVVPTAMAIFISECWRSFWSRLQYLQE